jgi:hypothetical protein
LFVHVTPGFVATRRSLHALAENVLAGDLARNTSKVGLRVTTGGFGQPEHFVADRRRRLRIDGDDLVVLDGDDERWERISTMAAAATFAGVKVGPPAQYYEPSTSPDTELVVDRSVAAELAEWLVLAEQIIEAFRSRHRRDLPTIAQLWPEHFDLSITMKSANFGASLGDAAHPAPYLYVAPWRVPEGSFWTYAWGSAFSWESVTDVESGLAHLEEGNELIRYAS